MATATTSSSQSSGASAGSSASTYQIPAYPEESILDAIATATANLAPNMYQWAQGAYNQGESLAQQLEAQAQSYASPTRVASDMGMAESGAAQGIDAARTNALQDLQSYGIDPSAGRFAGLDRAAQVQKGAAIAGAGNQQRLATEATGRALGSEAANVQLSNENIGAQLMGLPNTYLNTASQLKYPPLGQVSSSDTSSTQQSTSSSVGAGGGGGAVTSPSLMSQDIASTSGPSTSLMEQMFGFAGGGFVPPGVNARGGGYLPPGLSPSHGQQTDDISAKVDAGEFVMPRDVTQYWGHKHFQGMIDKARQAMAGSGSAKPQTRGGMQHAQTGGGFSPGDAGIMEMAIPTMPSNFGQPFSMNPGIIGNVPGSAGWMMNNQPTAHTIQVGPTAYVTDNSWWPGAPARASHVNVPSSQQLLQALQSRPPTGPGGVPHMAVGGPVAPPGSGNPFWNNSALVDPYGMMNGTVYSPGWMAGGGYSGTLPGSPSAYFNDPQMDPHEGQTQIGPSTWVSNSALPGGGRATVNVPSSQQLLQALRSRASTGPGGVPHMATGGTVPTTPSPVPIPSAAGSGLNQYFTDPNYLANWNYTPPPPPPPPPPPVAAPLPVATPGGGGGLGPPTMGGGLSRYVQGGGQQQMINGGDRNGRDNNQQQMMGGGGHAGINGMFVNGLRRGGRDDDDNRGTWGGGSSVVPPTTTPTVPTAPAAPAGPSNVVGGIDTTTGGVNTGPRYGMTPSTVVPNLFTGVPVDTPLNSSFYQKGFV